MSSNEKITLENLFNLLNSVPSADRQAVIEVVYQAAKSKIDDLIENYNQIYGFFDQLTAFAVATGEQFNVKKPKRLDFNKIQDFYVNESTDQNLGSNEQNQNVEVHPEPAPESVTESEPQKEEQTTQSSEADEADPKVEDGNKTDETEEQKTQLSDEELRKNFVSELESYGCKFPPEIASSFAIEELEKMLNKCKSKQANAA